MHGEYFIIIACCVFELLPPKDRLWKATLLTTPVCLTIPHKRRAWAAPDNATPKDCVRFFRKTACSGSSSSVLENTSSVKLAVCQGQFLAWWRQSVRPLRSPAPSLIFPLPTSSELLHSTECCHHGDHLYCYEALASTPTDRCIHITRCLLHLASLQGQGKYWNPLPFLPGQTSTSFADVLWLLVCTGIPRDPHQPNNVFRRGMWDLPKVCDPQSTASSGRFSWHGLDTDLQLSPLIHSGTPGRSTHLQTAIRHTDRDCSRSTRSPTIRRCLSVLCWDHASTYTWDWRDHSWDGSEVQARQWQCKF